MAAKDFLVHLNIGGNEIQDVKFELLVSDPTLVEGRFWYNTTDNVARYYDGTTVIDITDGTITLDPGVVTQDTLDLTSGVLTVSLATGTTHGAMDFADKSKIDASTSLPTVSTLVERDANGRAQIADGVSGTDIVNFQQLEAVATGVMRIVGTIDASTNPNYPAAVTGDSYLVSADGRVGGALGKVVTTGDLVVCLNDNAGGDEATVGADWLVLEMNLNQATETDLGIARLATQAEVNTGTDDETIVTPLKLQTKLDNLTFAEKFSILLDSADPNVARVFSGGVTTFTVTHTLNTLDFAEVGVRRISNGRYVTGDFVAVNATTVTIEGNGNIADGLFQLNLVG